MVREMGIFSRNAGRGPNQGADPLCLIVPGMAVFWFLGPKDRRLLVWSGWWTWLLPLALFLSWLLIGCSTNPEFYNDVVVREFMSRFDQSLKAYEKQQPIWFYFPHLLHKFAPWSLLALSLCPSFQEMCAAKSSPTLARSGLPVGRLGDCSA